MAGFWPQAFVLGVILLGVVGCGGSPKQTTAPGKVNPAEVKAHDAQVDEAEKAQRQKEQP